MIQSGFLSEEDRKALTALARDGSSPCRVSRRANALVLLDEGWSCQQVADALLLDDDTIRGWRKLFEQGGIEGVTSFDVGGSASYLSVKQEDDLKAWVGAALPRSTRQIGAWIAKEFGVVYESRSGLIALLHRLGLEYHKPNVIPRKLDEEKQKAFIESYENLLNSLARRRGRAVRGRGTSDPCRAARWLLGAEPREAGDRADERASAHQYSRRDRSGDRTNPDDRGPDHRRRLDDPSAGNRSRRSIRCSALIHVFLDNARYHHAKLVQAMAGPAGTPDQAALHPGLLPALEPDRAVMGGDAQTRHAQQVLRQLADSSPMQCSLSCARKFRKTGRTSAIPSPTISASSTQRIFGF